MDLIGSIQNKRRILMDDSETAKEAGVRIAWEQHRNTYINIIEAARQRVSFIQGLGSRACNTLLQQGQNRLANIAVGIMSKCSRGLAPTAEERKQELRRQRLLPRWLRARATRFLRVEMRRRAVMVRKHGCYPDVRVPVSSLSSPPIIAEVIVSQPIQTQKEEEFCSEGPSQSVQQGQGGTISPAPAKSSSGSNRQMPLINLVQSRASHHAKTQQDKQSAASKTLRDLMEFIAVNVFQEALAEEVTQVVHEVIVDGLQQLATQKQSSSTSYAQSVVPTATPAQPMPPPPPLVVQLPATQPGSSSPASSLLVCTESLPPLGLTTPSPVVNPQLTAEVASIIAKETVHEALAEIAQESLITYTEESVPMQNIKPESQPVQAHIGEPVSELCSFIPERQNEPKAEPKAEKEEIDSSMDAEVSIIGVVPAEMAEKREAAARQKGVETMRGWPASDGQSEALVAAAALVAYHRQTMQQPQSQQAPAAGSTTPSPAIKRYPSFTLLPGTSSPQQVKSIGGGVVFPPQRGQAPALAEPKPLNAQGQQTANPGIQQPVLTQEPKEVTDRKSVV